MATLRLFAQAREAAGTKSLDIDADTVGELLDQARRQLGSEFAAVLDGSKVWRNGSPTGRAEAIGPGDEVAVLPPVSGG